MSERPPTPKQLSPEEDPNVDPETRKERREQLKNLIQKIQAEQKAKYEDRESGQ